MLDLAWRSVSALVGLVRRSSYQGVVPAMRTVFVAGTTKHVPRGRVKTLQLYLCPEHQHSQIREEIKDFGCKTPSYKRTSQQMWPKEQASVNLGAGARPSQPEEMEDFHLG